MPTYPFITLVVKRQKQLALGAALLLLLLFVAGALLCRSPLLGVVGLILAAVIWFLVRLLGEVVHVIAETLLPR